MTQEPISDTTGSRTNAVTYGAVAAVLVVLCLAIAYAAMSDRHSASSGNMDAETAEKAALEAATAPSVSEPETGIGSVAPSADDQDAFVAEPAQEVGPELSKIEPLLTLIGTYESQGNYNAYYGDQDNLSDPEFTTMTLTEVLDWQRGYINRGSVSSAVGKYQIIDKTITKLAPQIPLGMDAVFDRQTQDLFAAKILQANGLDDFLAGHLSAETFGTNLAREWSSLPVLTRVGRIHAGEGYYGGHMRLHVREFEDVLARIGGRHKGPVSANTSDGAAHGHTAERVSRRHHVAPTHYASHSHHERKPHQTARTHHEEEYRQKSLGATHRRHTAHERFR